MSKKRKNSAFQRSRRQIVVVVMTAFLLLFVVTLLMIYTLSYRELYQENQDMLEMYVEQYRENGNPSEVQSGETSQESSGEVGQPEQDIPSEMNDLQGEDDLSGQGSLPEEDTLPEQDGLPEQGEHPGQDDQANPDTTRFLLSSFYSVAFDEDGQIYSVDLGSGTLYTEVQLSEAAAYLLETGRDEGTYGNFVYSIDYEETYTLVVLMDNTLISDSFTTLFRNTLVLGAVMVGILFLCAIALARWIIRPLEESDRRQRQFISDAGHELKTPVSVVEANAELLEREIGANKWLKNIRSESIRMARLVSELLVLARTEQVNHKMEALNFSRLVLGGVLPFESVAFEMGRELDCQVDENITIQGNPGQLSQLVSILMDNALSHSAGEGNIMIKLYREKPGVVLTISNPGNIPEQEMTEIFARFFRGDANRSDVGHYGLGLTIAKNIVAEHQGEITAACRDGQVSFCVFLPDGEKKFMRRLYQEP